MINIGSIDLKDAEQVSWFRTEVRKKWLTRVPLFGDLSLLALVP